MIQTARRKCRSKSRTAPVASAGTADSFPGDRATRIDPVQSGLVDRFGPSRRTSRSARLTGSGGNPSSRVTRPSGGRSRMKGTGSPLEIHRVPGDRRTGPQARDGVIPQHDRSVNPGGRARDRAAGPARRRPRPSRRSLAPRNRSTRPSSKTPSSSSTSIRSGFARQNARACGLQQRIAAGR